MLRILENIGFDAHASILIENYLGEKTERVVLNWNLIRLDQIEKRRSTRLLFSTSIIYPLRQQFSKDCRKRLPGRPVCRRHFFYIRH